MAHLLHWNGGWSLTGECAAAALGEGVDYQSAAIIGLQDVNSMKTPPGSVAIPSFRVWHTPLSGSMEIVLLVGSDEVYSYLADVFWYDWGVEP
ncbi:MAG: hypothetical protein NT169_07020 [Chloroflexi bacterium]|nr:hypothetical protein [Chloroflexota bacterium]